MTRRTVLVTGATGYVGGRLVPQLLEAGHRVRCLVRDPDRLQGRPWASQVEVAVGDVLQPETLPAALNGIEVVYYLIHSLRDRSDFQRRDLQAAQFFSSAARDVGIQRLVYLGGLGDPATALSRHLRSRQETDQVLRNSGVPVTEFRATIFVEAGGVSFEMVCYLTERLPIMICPRWVYTRVQPIAIDDVLRYLVRALTVPKTTGKIIEIGGADVLTYGAMMLGYAQVRGLHRILIPVPVLTPQLSAYWVHWITPIPAAIAHALIAGLRNEVVVRDDTAHHLFPDLQPIGYVAAVEQALARLEAGDIETSWTDALGGRPGERRNVALTTQEGIIIEHRERQVAAPPAVVYRVFTGLGGRRGWLYANWAWQRRGTLDWLVGGVGMRRGRRHPDDLRVGDTVDFWRVETLEPSHLLRLRAEMKVPGRAWLQFEAVPETDGTTRLQQQAFFAPKGLWGFLYWYVLYPVHGKIFSGLIREVGRQAETVQITPPR